jgi:hypothetical protein
VLKRISSFGKPSPFAKPASDNNSFASSGENGIKISGS